MANKLQRSNIEDRISALPKELRQHILTFLPTKDAISTSILSSIWRFDWLYLPNLKLDRSFFDKSDDLYMLEPQKKQEVSLRYLEFLERVITKRKYHEPIIPQIELYLTAFPELFPKISSFLSQLHVNKLILRVNFGGYKTMIDNECLKSILDAQVLSELYIDQGTLSIQGSFVLPSHLRKLTLYQVYLDEVDLSTLMASCTEIESLCFGYCSGFGVLKVSVLPKLRKLKILDDQKSSIRVEIDVPNLDSLIYRLRNPDWLGWSLKYSDFINLTKLVLEDCNLTDFNESCMIRLETLKIIGCINVENCGVTNAKELKTFVLESCDITDDWINECLLELGKLEVLRIAHCDLLENLKISLDCLRKLSLLGCDKLCTLEVQCPSLCEVTYVNMYNLIFLALETTFTLTSVDLYLPYWEKESTEHMKLSGWFKSILHCRTLTLRAYHIEDMLILRKMRQCACPPLCEVKSINLSFIEKRASSPSLAKIMEPLIWLLPQLELMRLDFAEPKSSISLKFTHRSNGMIGCGCYGFLPIHCWKHSVTDFVVKRRVGFKNDYSLERFFERVVTCED